MHRTSVSYKIGAGPGVSGKELERKQIALESIARSAGDHEVARIVRPAVGEREHVIKRRRVLIKVGRAVYTALAAVAQGSPTQRPLEGGVDDPAGAQFDEVSRAGATSWIRVVTSSDGGSLAWACTASPAVGEAEIRMTCHGQPPHNDDAPTEANDLTSGRVAMAYWEANRAGC